MHNKREVGSSIKQLGSLLDWQLILLGLIILLLVNVNQLMSWTQGADYLLYDNQLQLLSVSPDEHILIIEIDEQSLSLLGDWPWPRSYHGQMIELLSQADARVIAYNIVFSHSDPSDENDAFLAQTIKISGRTILPLYFDRLLKEGDVLEVLPADEFRQHAGLGHVNSYLDSDGTLRSIRLIDRFLDHQWPHFSFASFLFNQPYSELFLQSHADVYIPFVTEGDFKRYSFVDVLTGLVPPQELYPRTIFVGVTATSMGDPLLTPVDDSGRQSPAVDINANIFQALEHNSLIQSLPVWVSFFINSSIIILVLFLIPRLSGLQQLVMTLTCFLLVCFLSYGLLNQGYWYQSAGLMMALVIIPFIWNLLRLSRLFNYFRQQLKGLRQQQARKIFHLPEYIRLNSEADLKSILSLIQIDDYWLLDDVSTDDSSMLSVVKYLDIQIAQDKKVLALYFEDFTDFERRKVSILYQLLSAGTDSIDEKSLASSIDNAPVSVDIFSQQLALVESFQQQLTMSHSLFEASIEGIAAGILVTDLAGNVLFNNKMLSELAGKHILELAELFPLVSLRQGDWINVLRDVILLQQPITVEARLMNTDLSVSIRCIESQQSLAPLLVFNLTDVSALKQAHRSRNEMIDFLSHDLRSPMASLQALVNQTRALSPSDQLTTVELIDKVDHYSQRGLHFSEQFLSLAQVESDEGVQIYEVDLYSVSQNAIDTLYHQAQEKSIKLHLDAIDECWVMGNGDLLERIILNLVSNAIKYSPNKSQVVVNIAFAGDNSQLELRVNDQGPGISLDLVTNLFKPYKRGADHNTLQAKGIGLGLRFVDVALKRLNSQINFDSSKDGSSFYFYLEKIDL